MEFIKNQWKLFPLNFFTMKFTIHPLLPMTHSSNYLFIHWSIFHWSIYFKSIHPRTNYPSIFYPFIHPPIYWSFSINLFIHSFNHSFSWMNGKTIMSKYRWPMKNHVSSLSHTMASIRSLLLKLRVPIILKIKHKTCYFFDHTYQCRSIIKTWLAPVSVKPTPPACRDNNITYDHNMQIYSLNYHYSFSLIPFHTRTKILKTVPDCISPLRCSSSLGTRLIHNVTSWFPSIHVLADVVHVQLITWRL